MVIRDIPLPYLADFLPYGFNHYFSDAGDAAKIHTVSFPLTSRFIAFIISLDFQLHSSLQTVSILFPSQPCILSSFENEASQLKPS